MALVFWLREETKKNEFRRALTPDSCAELIKSGHKVVVEDWENSIIPIQEYLGVGCQIVKAGSWVDADKETIVVGLKALPENIIKFIHRHIFFAHVYKEQQGWQDILLKFVKGGGEIIDLEYMLNENKRRVCAFGYWAGYVGAALGVLFSKTKDKNKTIKELADKIKFPNKLALLEFVNDHTKSDNQLANEAIVIGSVGRSGNGAMDCLKELGWTAVGWDRQDTKSGGPFKEILKFDLFVNCVLTMKKMPPFITMALLMNSDHKLNMISDVSCDPDSECNMVPLYKKATVINAPVISIKTGLGLIAIDNLPSVLPKESSYDFSSQLVQHLLNEKLDSKPVLKSIEIFNENIFKL